MARYQIYSNSRLIGSTLLEYGDPPMGVAFGEFVPEPGYALVQTECKSNHSDQTGLALTAHTESGLSIPCVGVAVLDYSEHGEPPYIEATVLGIPYPTYSELFPEHVAEYDQRLRTGGKNDA